MVRGVGAGRSLRRDGLTKMHIGYFDCFRGGGDTLLVEAAPKELLELQAAFELLASGRLKRLIVHRMPFSRPHRMVELRAVRVQQDNGVRRDEGRLAFLWERSREGWLDAAAKIGQLAASEEPGHQYLEAERDEVVVQVSKGEYGEAWWAAEDG